MNYEEEYLYLLWKYSIVYRKIRECQQESEQEVHRIRRRSKTAYQIPYEIMRDLDQKIHQFLKENDKPLPDEEGINPP